VVQTRSGRGATVGSGLASMVASRGETVREGMVGASEEGSARRASEEEAKYIDYCDRSRRSARRQLNVFCARMVKAVLGDMFTASHEVKAAQWAKSKGTPRCVLDFVAEHGLWATDSRVYLRESKFAKAADDANLMPKHVKCGAFTQDNCDFEPAIGVRQGEGPHVSAVAALAFWLDEGGTTLARGC